MADDGRLYTREVHLQGKYKLSQFDFDVLLDEQNGRCAICTRNIRGLAPDGRALAHVDHDHVTGKNRKLLCGNCNVGLGMFKDSIRNLASAIVYLEDHGKRF